MAFTQIMTVEGADEQALHDLVAKWDADQAGIAPGYLGARVLADQKTAGRYLIVVDFTSEEEARQNSERPETNAWAEKLRELADGEPTYLDLREVCTTYERG
jgi:quinol monooxygenase YgiN